MATVAGPIPATMVQKQTTPKYNRYGLLAVIKLRNSNFKNVVKATSTTGKLYLI
jgi:hypothetical protein